MMKSKKILATVLSAVLCLTAVTACGKSPEKNDSTATGTAEATEASAAHSEETVTITFWHNYSAESAENDTLMNVLIPKFEEENPGIKVKASSYEWADLHDHILVSAQSDTLPDCARCDIAWLPEFEEMGVLVPLDKEIDGFQAAKDSLLESAMSTALLGENYYGLPLNTNTKILYYNTKILADAGVSVPQTMDEFAAAVKKLSGTNTNGQQIWGYDEPGLSGWNLCPFIWSFGGSLTNEEQTKASGYINSKETVAAIQMLADLYGAKAITGWNSGDIPMTDGFGTERYAMLFDGPWKIAELKGGYPDLTYETANIPAGKGGSVSVLGGEDLAMFKSANKEAAWKFMTFMTSEYAQVEMAKCGQIPVNTAALGSDTVKEAAFAPYLEAIKTAKARPTVPSWTEIDGELSAAVASVMNGEKTAQEAMDELAVKVDTLLAQ